MSSSTYPLIPTPLGDWEKSVFDIHAIRMAAIHNILIRSFNSIIYHAPTVEKKDVPAFMKYCNSVAAMIHEHHATEEELIFPFFEEKLGKGAMESNVTQHLDFMPKFDEWANQVKSILAGQAEYNADEFVKLTKEGTDILVVHLQDEIPTMDSNRLREHFSEQELQGLEKQIVSKAQELGSLWDIPLFFVGSDQSHNSWFPPIPSPVIFMVRHVVMPLSGGMWKYGQSDKYMNLKNEFKAGYGLS